MYSQWNSDQITDLHHIKTSNHLFFSDQAANFTFFSGALYSKKAGRGQDAGISGLETSLALRKRWGNAEGL